MRKQLSELRDCMRENQMDYYYMRIADPHASEYINAHFEEIRYFSGFTGSNALLLAGMEKAWLWTDGRYFVQAAKELEGSGIELMKLGEPGVKTLREFLADNLKQGDVLGFDGKRITLEEGELLQKVAEKAKASIRYERCLTDLVWTYGRPADSSEKLEALPEDICGESAKDKITKIRKQMEKEGAEGYFLSKLDDQMWLFNVRGSDIAYNPVAYAYTLFWKDRLIVFLKRDAIKQSPAVSLHVQALGAEVLPYEEAEEAALELVEAGRLRGKIWVDPQSVSFSFGKLFGRHHELLRKENPTELLKAVKNATEIQRTKECYLLDSLAVTRFLRHMKTKGSGMTEVSAGELLDSMRRQLPGFLELSFPTICAYQENAAMMHYEAVSGKDKQIEKEGILLVDSGGQYLSGTTDVTRSIVLGPLSDEIRKQYTKVCCGMLRLMNAVFLKGCTGQNLDVLAREPLWEMQLDYKCGTGHGIGYILNVHEGPQRISWQHREGTKMVPLKPGMIVSDEPGVYVEGSHGIRIETILLCVEKGKNGKDEFLGFEPLTFVPIDLEGIEPSEMNSADKRMLNEYHRMVYEKLSPLMEEEERGWLRDMTMPLS